MRPILLSAPGRSGTTLMMRTLDQSPEIVIARTPPFEARLLAYYTYALRALTLPGNIEKSTHPDRLAATLPFMIGSNPYTAPQFLHVFKDKEAQKRLIEGRIPARVRTAFRENILDYYAIVARQYERPEAMFFAEKNNTMDRRVAAFCAQAFGPTPEIFMVRDPRDLYCSHRSYFRSDAARAAHDVAGAAKALVGIRNKRATGSIIIRYEDMVRERDATARSLSEFLGVEVPAQKIEAGFDRHGTSASQDASIGRWRTDMTDAEKDSFLPMVRESLDAFGYSD